jgi:hypothetical protein
LLSRTLVDGPPDRVGKVGRHVGGSRSCGVVVSIAIQALM